MSEAGRVETTRRRPAGGKRRRVLVLGAGLVAKPLVDDLLDPSRGRPLEVELAALDLDRAERLLGGRPGEALHLDVADAERLSRRVAGAAAVVSLLPAPLHPTVARACLEHGKPLITTSYVSEEMRGLDTRARERGVLLLNECGLDPGIDHLMAMEVLRRVRGEGRHVSAYASYAGGLPAPGSDDNPWGYKLSWSPRAVLIAARSPVRYLRGGEVVEGATPFEVLPPPRLKVPGVGSLEIYPNRDSLPYRDLYGLERAVSVLRGTLRYPGWCETFRALLDLGLLSLDSSDLTGESWARLLASRLPGGAAGTAELRAQLASALEVETDHPVLERFAWLGLLSDDPLPEADTPLDALAGRMAERMGYRPGERDLVVLVHRFTVEEPGFTVEEPGSTVEGAGGRERIESRLQVVGEAGDDSAMARTVGLTAAAACRLVLEGRTDLTGVHIPVHEQLVGPLLGELAARGLEPEERVEEI